MDTQIRGDSVIAGIGFVAVVDLYALKDSKSGYH